MIVKCKRTSLVRLRLPAICLPSRSTAQMSSGVMNPLQISVGEHNTSFGPTRNEMFPSFAAANPFAYTRRPISQISSLMRRSLIPLFHLLVVMVEGLSLRVEGQKQRRLGCELGRRHVLTLNHKPSTLNLDSIQN